MNLKIREIINRKFYYLLTCLLLLESLSFFSYFFPLIREISFFLIVLTVIVLAFKNLKYALYAVIIEIIIGSHGYIFFSEIFDFQVSIRIALWMLVMIAWFIKYVVFIKDYLQTPIENKKKQRIANTFIYFPIYLLLFFFVFIATIKGALFSSSLGVWFEDFNSWLYFLILLPLIYVFKNNNTKKLLKDLTQIFLAGVIWISVKTLILLFLFSHNFEIIEPIYAWSRQYLLAEITALPSGFYRIFLQSHIYSMLAIIISLFSLPYLKNTGKKSKIYLIVLLSIILSSTLLSLSRSIWLGLLVAFLIWLVYLIYKYKKSTIYYSLVYLTLSFLLAIALIVGIINIPSFGYTPQVNTGQTFKDRANLGNNDEAAISSRWSLLTPMTKEIIKSPVIGHGFGKEITYTSQDPRVLENNESGEYTTHAFEWGWLSIWLKMGILGLLAYLWLFYRLITDSFKTRHFQPYLWSLGVSLISLMAVNFFTPYLNHPLGIMYLLIISVIISASRKINLEN